MRNLIKETKNMGSSQEVLNLITKIQKMIREELHKDVRGLTNNYEILLEVETIAYKEAIKKAISPEEIEAIAVSLEDDFQGDPYLYDEYIEWSEIVRINAYGYEWFLKKEFNSPAYKEFERFTETQNIKNPFEELSSIVKKY